MAAETEQTDTRIALVAEYLTAFTEANPDLERPKVFYEHGWFRFEGRGFPPRRYRAKQIMEMRDNLIRQNAGRLAHVG